MSEFANKLSVIQSVNGHKVVYLGMLRVAHLHQLPDGSIKIETLANFNDTIVQSEYHALEMIQLMILAKAS